MTSAISRVIAATMLTALLSPAGAQSSAADASLTPLHERVARAAAEHEQEFIALRHDLHRHPEVSGNEVRTAGIVAERMRLLGLEVRTGVGGHGVVAILRGGRSGPVVAWRADMDAVDSVDPDPVDYRSVVAGVRHICGHDVHTAIAVALAASLASVKAELPGTIMFIFQPAEERATGARAMLDAGIFASELPSAIFGLHTAPYEVGEIGSRPAGMMAAMDVVQISISGSGDISAAVDRVRAMLSGLNTVPANQQFQPMPADFVFLQILPGERREQNAIVRASVTLASDSTRERVMRSISSQLAALRVPEIRITHGYEPKQVPGVTNDSALTTGAMAVLRTTLGAAAVHDVTMIIPPLSENCDAFQEQIPGTFFFLGVSNRSLGTVGMPHTPSYVADDSAILAGVKAMSAVILDRLERASR